MRETRARQQVEVADTSNIVDNHLKTCLKQDNRMIDGGLADRVIH